MKRILFAIVALSLALSAGAQQVVRDDWQQLQVDFKTDGFSIERAGDFAVLTAEACVPAGEVGRPSLPVFSLLIEVPLCKGFEVKVTDAEYDTLEIGLPVMPMQAPCSKSDTTRHALVVDTKVYTTDAWLGGGASVEAVGIARDRRLARLQFEPMRYNPAKGSIIICRKATVTVTYIGTDREGTLEMFERYYSPAFNSGMMSINALYPKNVRTTAPVRYLIVAHAQFRGQMDEFIQWKRRKGFITDIAYTDDPGVGTTTTAIQDYIQSQYDNATTTNPAPTYLLLVGDVAQIPAFDGTTQNNHITDLYYTTWTSGDHLPDCYHGRFSAQNLSQLQPQIDKTLMYEQYTFADPSFLDRAVMVAGVDGGNAGDYGYTHADPAMDYAITNYINGAHGWANVYYFKNNTSIVPSGVTNVTIGSSGSSNSATVRSYYNQGAGWINYTAHGGSTGWGTPNFGNSHVEQMTNVQKFGILIGNCCQTNMYGESTCFGEALLRKGNYCGAVGYIGGSDYTYWGEDFYWAVGVRSGIGPSMSMSYNSTKLGAYDRICHTHGEAYAQWATSQGGLMYLGNMAVESSTSGLKHYYWEIYHLMGDPSVMTYLTQADTMTMTVQPTLIYGTATLNVTAVPYAYVALTDTATHTLQGAGFADANGQVTLTLPSNMPVGSYELAASAQQYRTAFRTVNVVQPTGAFPLVSAVNPSTTLVAGDTVALGITIDNIGNVMAHNVVAHLTTSNDALTLLSDSIVLDSLAAGDQHVHVVLAVASPNATDGTPVTVSTISSWTGMTLPAVSNIALTINAPKLVVITSPDIFSMHPGDTLQLAVELINVGHAPLTGSRLALTSPTSLVAVSTAMPLPEMQHGDTVNVVFNINTLPTLPEDIEVPLVLTVDGSLPVFTETLSLFVGQAWCETFEDGYVIDNWTAGGNLPWEIIDSTSWQGSHCVRSAHGLSHNQSSELMLTVDIPVTDSVIFNYAVSSEGSYDKFYFYIDTTELLVTSGEVDWTRASYPITAGLHTLRFAYIKDYSVSRNHDCAWIDMLKLPHAVRPVSFSSADLCQGQPYVSGNDTISTDQPGAFSLTYDNGSTVVIEDIVIYPASYTIDTVEACDVYTWHGTEYTSSCNTVSSFSSEYGCDSVVGLMLTIHHSSDDTELIEGCDSCTWGGVQYYSSSNITGSYTNIYGCDSIVLIKIRVHRSVVTIDSVTATAEYTWNGEIYTESGSYTMVLGTVDGCDSTVTLVLNIESEDIDEWTGEGEHLSVWPNPATNRLTFNREVESCHIYDIAGRLKAEYEHTQHIDLASLPRGVYMLRVTTAGGSATLRVVLH